VLNVEYGIRLKKFQKSASWFESQLYVVDEPGCSPAWLAGVDSLTTNNVHSCSPWTIRF